MRPSATPGPRSKRPYRTLCTLSALPARAQTASVLSPPFPHQRPPQTKKPKYEEEEDGEEDPPHLTPRSLRDRARSAQGRHHAASALPLPRACDHWCTRRTLCAHIAYTRVPATHTPTLLLRTAVDCDTPRRRHSHAACRVPEERRWRWQGKGEGERTVPETGAVPRLTPHHSMSTPLTFVSAHKYIFYSHHPAPSTPLSRLVPLHGLSQRGAPLAGITAFRGVRETSLWFLDGAAGGAAGTLMDTRPAEFWELADLAQGDAGMRLCSATGRTCTVVLTRRSAYSPPQPTPEREHDEGEKTLIVGKERWEWSGCGA